MAHFTWRERGLSSDCASLEAMAPRFEEAASLMRRLAREGFRVERHAGGQRIVHNSQAVFGAYGFIDEEPALRQLTLMEPTTSEAEGSA